MENAKKGNLPITTQKKLIDYLKENLTFSKFIELHNYMCITKKKFSRLLNGIDSWNFTTVQSLSNLTNISPNNLIKKFKLKNEITINEMASLNDWWDSLKGGKL